MSSLALLALVLYFGQTLSVPRNCTVNDLCLPVNASVCDNSKCLPVNQSEIDEFSSIGLKSYTWNVGLLVFSNSCSFNYDYETLTAYDGTVTTYRKFTFINGPSCNESSSLKFEFKELNDTTGCSRKQWNVFGSMIQTCYLYFEPGVALVSRTCLVDPNYSYGEACAAIYVEVHPDAYVDLSKLDVFLESLGVKLDKITNDCML